VLGEALPDVLKGMRAAELTAAKAALSAMLDPEKEGIG
jgi:hypothetical protein